MTVIDFAVQKLSRTHAGRWLNAVQNSGLPKACMMFAHVLKNEIGDDTVRNVVWLNQPQISSLSSLTLPEVRTAANQLAEIGALSIMRLGEIPNAELRDRLLWLGKDPRAYVYLLVDPAEWTTRGVEMSLIPTLNTSSSAFAGSPRAWTDSASDSRRGFRG